MPRYSNWRKLSFGKVPEPLVSFGKSLLGYLDTQRQLSGVATQARQVVLPDGSSVFAAFYGETPLLRITPPAPGTPPCPGCPIYMETGALELGVNSETDVLDQPVVAATAPSIERSEYSTCGQDKPQGTLSVYSCADGRFGAGGNCSEPAIAKACDAVTGLVTLADKKSCQARLQPSLWTGVMQRWVQAMYGNPKAVYKCATLADPSFGIDLPHLQTLATDGETWVDITYAPYYHLPTDTQYGTLGLIDLGGCNYRFVDAQYDHAVVYQTDLTACGKALARIVKGMKTDTLAKRQRRDRLEAYLLTQLTLNTTEPVTIAYGTPVDDALCYGWKFSPRAPEMAIVTVAGTTHPQATLRRRVFSLDVGGNVVITEHDDAPANISLMGNLWNALCVPYLDNRSSVDGNSRGFTGNFLNNHVAGPLADFDAPIYCWYMEDGTLEVIRATLTMDGVVTPSDDACWPDYSGTLPNFSQACSTNNPCLQHANYKYNSAAMGFYSARASTVALISWGSDVGGSARHVANASWQAISYDVTMDTGGRVYLYPITPPSNDGGVPNGDVGVYPGGGPPFTNSAPCTFTYKAPFQGFGGCTIGGDTTTAHGCTYNAGVNTPGSENRWSLVIVCPSPGGAPSHGGQWVYTTGGVTGLGSPTYSGGGGYWWSQVTFTPQLANFTRKTATWSEKEATSALLIIPAGSASAAVMCNETVNWFSGSSGGTTGYQLCDCTIDTDFGISSATCTYTSNNGTDVGSTIAASSVTFVPPTTNPIQSGRDANCPLPLGHDGSYDRGWSLAGMTYVSGAGNGTYVFPELNPDGSPTSSSLGSGATQRGEQSITNLTLLGFYNSAVVALDTFEGSFNSTTGTYDPFVPVCLTAPSNSYAGAISSPIDSVFMDPSLTWPTDAQDFWTTADSDTARTVTNSAVLIKAAMVVHTSVGGALAYFNDWPALRATLADNHLAMTQGYDVMDRLSFVGWA